ncbi:MAG: ribose 5-phosphate isomerase B [Flavobacteriales bacterium]|nr:ribose 5-phosphate isomerase B [Flavobacteriales bacterium]
MKIAIGSDHAGVDYKKAIVELLKSKGIEVEDFGPFTTDSVDYPDYIHPVAQSVEDKKADRGIILCGTGNGAGMTANKHQGVRAALCWCPEIARLARQHNDANVLDIPARFVTLEQALEMVEIFLCEPFEGGRHICRINKIPCSK